MSEGAKVQKWEGRENGWRGRRKREGERQDKRVEDDSR